MNNTIDWMYDRSGCATCKKSRGFLEAASVTVQETCSANKVRYGHDEALGVLDGIRRLIVIKGKKVSEFDLTEQRPDDETLLQHLLGPTGNLRAPTLRRGNTLMVGFQEEAYQAWLAEEST